MCKDPLADLDPDRDQSADADKLRKQLNRLTKDHQQLTKDYQTLLDVMLRVNSSLNLEEILKQVVDGIVRVTGCERGFLMLREPDGSLSFAIARSNDEQDLPEQDFSVSLTIVNQVAETHEHSFAPSIQETEDLRDSKSILAMNTQSYICLPMEFEDRLVGVIYADSKTVSPELLDPNQDTARAFSAQAAVAIANAQRHGELQIRQQALEEQNRNLRLVEEFASHGINSRSKEMHEVFELVDKLAPFDTSVLVIGDTGTGKELIARAIHKKSNRRDKPFKTVNCAAIPENLEESELFGHVKGSFTGAIRDKIGAFKAADQGTLFLDEIGDMALGTQAKILRVLQEGEIQRLGDERVQHVDVRIIAATHRDLAKATEERRFRPDLYFRLRGAQVCLPTLRARRQDVIPLAELFMKQFAEKHDKPVPWLPRETKELLLENQWEGNIRELKSAIELGVMRQIDEDQIPASAIATFLAQRNSSKPAADDGDGSLRSWMRACEEKFIRNELAKHDGNITSTAKKLGISRQQLHNKMKKLGISARNGG